MKIIYIIVLVLLNSIHCVQWREKSRNDWRPVNHWRKSVNQKPSNWNRRSFDENGFLGSNEIPVKNSNEYRIEWYSRYCRETGKFCDQLRKAKGYAMNEYKRKMKQSRKDKNKQQKLIEKIRKKNPYLNDALANNIKDYVMQRMRQENKRKYVQKKTYY